MILALRILLIHRNFPGQFRFLVAAWLRMGILIDAIGATDSQALPEGLLPQDYPSRLHYWQISAVNEIPEGVIDADLESAFRRGVLVAAMAKKMRDEDEVYPDVVIFHSAWGDGLHLRSVWPAALFIAYPELYGSPRCLGYGFDPLLPALTNKVSESIDRQNLLASAAVLCSDTAVVPTAFQRLSFPPALQPSLHCIHEGVDTDLFSPAADACFDCGNGLIFRVGDPVVTFVSRRLEALRGLRTFVEALPALMRSCPDVQVVIAGDPLVGGYGSIGSKHPQGYLGETLESLGDKLDLGRLHCVGWLSMQKLIRLLQISAAHVYISYPYTLSWSVLQAMACATPVVGNGDGPLSEVVESNRNGLLVEFTDSEALARCLLRLLKDASLRSRLGQAARQTICDHYGLNRAAKAYLSLIEGLRTGDGGTKF